MESVGSSLKGGPRSKERSMSKDRKYSLSAAVGTAASGEPLRLASVRTTSDTDPGILVGDTKFGPHIVPPAWSISVPNAIDALSS